MYIKPARNCKVDRGINNARRLLARQENFRGALTDGQTCGHARFALSLWPRCFLFRQLMLREGLPFTTRGPPRRISSTTTNSSSSIDSFITDSCMRAPVQLVNVEKYCNQSFIIDSIKNVLQ